MRKRRTLSEKRRIVELTFDPGMSVARVAQAEGITYAIFRTFDLSLAPGGWYNREEQDLFHVFLQA